MCLFIWKAELWREVCHLMSSSICRRPDISWSEARRFFLGGFPRGLRGPSICTIFYCFPGCIGRELHPNWNSRGSNWCLCRMPYMLQVAALLTMPQCSPLLIYFEEVYWFVLKSYRGETELPSTGLLSIQPQQLGLVQVEPGASSFIWVPKHLDDFPLLLHCQK